MKKAVAYVRFSSDNQRQESIDAQVRAIKSYCVKNDYELVRIYADEAQSATNDQREQFLQLIEDSKQKQFEYAIVHKLDRFARNRYDSAFYRRELKNNGVRILSVLENLDDSPESVILESILEGMAEYYSMNLRREVKKGMNENALKGLHNGGTPPLGLNVNPDKTYSINEAEADAVRTIFTMYANNFGYQAIVDKLNNEGRLTKRGMPFTKNSITEILRNEKYLGRYVFNKRLSKKSGNRKYKNDSEITRIDGLLPRIISDELWNDVQAKMATQLKPRVQSIHFYLLTGHLECGCCGSSYVGQSYTHGRNGEKYYQYGCTKKHNSKLCDNKNIRADILESYVINYIKNELLPDEALDHMMSKIVGIVNEAVNINKKLARDVAERGFELKQQVEKLLDLYVSSSFEPQMLDNKLSKLKEEIAQCDLKLSELQTAEFEELETDRIRAHLVALREQLSDADNNIKKTVIDALIDKIIIYPEDIKVIFKIKKQIKKANDTWSLAQGSNGGSEPYIFLPTMWTRKELYT